MGKKLHLYFDQVLINFVFIMNEIFRTQQYQQCLLPLEITALFILHYNCGRYLKMSFMLITTLDLQQFLDLPLCDKIQCLIEQVHPLLYYNIFLIWVTVLQYNWLSFYSYALCLHAFKNIIMYRFHQLHNKEIRGT